MFTQIQQDSEEAQKIVIECSARDHFLLTYISIFGVAPFNFIQIY